MKRLPFLLMGLSCAALGFAAHAALDNEAIAQFLRDYMLWIAIVLLAGLLGLGLILVLGYRYARYRLHKLLDAEAPLTEAQIAQGLVDMFTTPDGVTDPTPADRQRAALVNAGAWLMRRQATQFFFNVTVTVVGGLIGTATLFLLYEQNQKIDLQNDRITLQTDAGITQSVLLEGARRAALSGDLSNLLQAIRDERAQITDACPSAPIELCYRVEPRSNGEVTYHLSKDLRSRVIAFAAGATPYRLAFPRTDAPLDFDRPLSRQYDFPQYSPERGQLLIVLVQNNISLRGLNLSYAYAPHVDLSAANLHSVNLSHADLSHAEARGTMFNNVRMEQARLRNTDFTSASFVNTQGGSVDLQNSEFRFATFTNTRLTDAWLMSANFTRAVIRQSSFQASNLSGADFSQAQVQSTVFTNARLNRTVFRDTVASSNSFVRAEFEGIAINKIRGSGNWITQATFREMEIAENSLRAFRIGRGYPPEGIALGTMVEHCDFELSRNPPGLAASNCAVEPVKAPAPSDGADGSGIGDATDF